MGQKHRYNSGTNRQIENLEYDHGFPSRDFPPPAPPNGRDDLWDLQFCRWWGWNWVRRRETEATPISSDIRREAEPTPIYSVLRRDNETTPISSVIRREAEPTPIDNDLGKDNETTPIRMESKQKPSKGCCPSKRPKEHRPKEHRPKEHRSKEHRPKEQKTILASWFNPEPLHTYTAHTHRPKEKVPLRELNRKKSPAPKGQSHSKRLCIEQETYYQSVDRLERPLPAKDQFKEMCKCLMGKNRHTTCTGMANLYKTPSASAVAIDRLSYGVADRVVMSPQYRPTGSSPNARKKTKRQQISEERSKVQSWSTVPDQETGNTVSEEIDSEPEPLGPQKRFSSTEESIEYVSVRLQHITSDSKCPFRNRCARAKEKANRANFVPTKEEVNRDSVAPAKEEVNRNSFAPAKEEVNRNSFAPAKEEFNSNSFAPAKEEVNSNSFAPDREEVNRNISAPAREEVPEPEEVELTNLEIQTSFNVPQGNKETQTSVEAVSSMPSNKDSPYAEKVFKLKGKKNKTICICVCCCGSCKQTNNENFQLGCIINSSEEHCSAQNDTTNKSSPTNGSPPTSSSIKKNALLSIDTGLNESSTNNLDTVGYSFFKTSPNTKKLTKFGNPSKNYPWMQNTASGATTTTLNNMSTFKSPATGETYDLTNLDYTNDKNLTLPDLIDISEDLSYLKSLENTTKSDDENRLLLDAVCDAILQEHQAKSLDFLTENDILSPRRKFNDLGIWCDLTQNFGVKRDAYTDLSESLLKNCEDVGTQLSKLSDIHDIVNNPNVKLGHIDVMLSNIMDNIFTESNSDVAQAEVSRKTDLEPFRVEAEARQMKHPFKFKHTEEVFTRTGLLTSKSNNSVKKPVKRGCTCKDDNVNKKLKQDEVKTLANPENKGNQNNGRTEEKIGTIFTKIEDIVKKSKLKSAEIQKVLNFVPSRQDSTSERVLETFSLNDNLAQSSFSNGKILETDAESSKRSYKISSDSFKGELSQYSKEDDQKNIKICYEVFGDKFGYSPDETPSCFGIASQAIVEEGNSNSGEETKKEKSKRCKEKISKLSIQSFIVCDERSSGVQKMASGGTSLKMEKKTLKKKKVCSKASLIPIRKQS